MAKESEGRSFFSGSVPEEHQMASGPIILRWKTVWHEYDSETISKESKGSSSDSIPEELQMASGPIILPWKPMAECIDGNSFFLDSFPEEVLENGLTPLLGITKLR